MLLLIGRHSYTIDPKGRLNIPPKFRSDLGDSFLVTYSEREPCLLIYSLTEWAVLKENIKLLSPDDAREFRRNVYGNAEEVEIDKQGRILVPINARKHAGLDRDVLIVGTDNRAEIWDKDKWEEYLNAVEKDKLFNTMNKLGF